MTAIGHGTAHAKLILFGEHVVLYGNPAIAIPVPSLSVTVTARRHTGRVRIDLAGADPTATLDDTVVDACAIPRLAIAVVCEHLGRPAEDLAIEIHNGIPLGRGLGSSAASAAAVIESIAALHDTALTADQRFELIQRCEAHAHGKASGIDARAVAHDGGPLWFRDGTVCPLEVATHNDAILTVVDTGVSASTHRAVALVAHRMTALGNDAAALLNRVAATTDAAVQDLANGRLAALGARLSENHTVLADLGVSCPEIDEVIDRARDSGAWGAKLSGGGLGGCVVVLGDTTATAKLAAALADTRATVAARIPLGRS